MCSFHREKIRFSLNALACLLLLPLAVHAVVTPPPPEGAAVTNHGKVAGSSKEITRSQSESGAINTVLVTAAQDLNPSAQELDTDGTFGRGGGDEKCCEGAKCDGDANGDGVVDPLDQGYILSRFGVDPSIKGCTADVNCDGVIDPLDAGYSLARFGTCLAPTLCAQGGGACGKSAPKMTLYEPHFACCKACACEAEGNTSGDPIHWPAGKYCRTCPSCDP